MSLALALIHHPVVDRDNLIITTAITNLDLHDMARSAMTYGVTDLFVVHPIAAQRELAQRIRDHWVTGSGKKRIPTREPAMSLLRIVPSLDDVYQALGGRAGLRTYVTSARRDRRPTTGFSAARAAIARAGNREAGAGDASTSLVLFGTGWGLAEAVLASADVLLEPIAGVGSTGYNHLSVRAACAIVLDRLCGTRRDE